MKLTVASLVAKGVAIASRLSGRGEATSAPGLAALKIDPQVVRRSAAQLDGCVIVTGTNGKTTTSHFIGSILKAARHPYIHNQSGSNLLRGIASALLLNPRRGKWGLFEVDEATMPAACSQLQPKVVVVTNLFRDQLDRYGELHTTAELIRTGLRQLPTGSVVVLNADDPMVASLGHGLEQQVLYFGLDDTSAAEQELPEAADSIITSSGELLDYTAVFLGHLGHYQSPARDVVRPQPDVSVSKITLDGIRASSVTLTVGRAKPRIQLRLPGIYNIYNAAAAMAMAKALGINATIAAKAIGSTAAAFGRVEQIKIGQKQLWLGLIKNPIGAGEVLRTIALDPQPKHLLIAINDNFADGTDVSWLWDAEFERLSGQVATVTVSGRRAADMAVRLKYAGIDDALVTVMEAIPQALEQALAAVPATQTLYVLPTYTAMLELRQELKHRGLVRHYLR